MRTLALELPDEILDLLDSPQAAAAKAREALVLALVSEGRVSQGQAARLLGVSRWDLLALMGQFGVPSGPRTAEEMRQEIANARRAGRR